MTEMWCMVCVGGCPHKMCKHQTWTLKKPLKPQFEGNLFWKYIQLNYRTMGVWCSYLHPSTFVSYQLSTKCHPLGFIKTTRCPVYPDLSSHICSTLLAHLKKIYTHKAGMKSCSLSICSLCTSSRYSADLQRSILHHANGEPASMSSGMVANASQKSEDDVSLCTFWEAHTQKPYLDRSTSGCQQVTARKGSAKKAD